MSDYSSLKATINADVKANNNHEITGSIMNSVLNAMVNSLGAGYQFMGVATPSNPGSAQTPDYKCFYLATTPGTYTNLGGLVVADGEVAILKYDTSWTKEVTGIASADQLNQLGQEVGLLKFTDMVDVGDIVIEQGSIGASGENYPGTARLRVKDAIPTSVGEIAVPDGFFIQAIFYYSAWTDSSNYTYDTFVSVVSQSAKLDTSKNYARPIFRNAANNDIVPIDLINSLYLVSPKIDTLGQEVDVVGKKTNGLFNLYGGFIASTIGAYTRINGVGTIPKGVVVENNSDCPIMMGETSDTTNRQDIPVGGTVTANSDKAYFQTLSGGGNVSLKFYTKNIIIGPGAVNTVNIVDEAITTPKLANNSITRDKLIYAFGQVLESTISKNGYVIIGPIAQAYGELSTTRYFPIPVGTKIVNNGIALILGSDSSLTNRKDLATGTTWVTTFQVNYIQAGANSGEVNLTVIGSGVDDNSITTPKIANGAVTNEKIAQKTVGLERLAFTRSTNLLDKNDSDVALGKYLNADGTLSSNASYNTTGFMPVESNSTYRLCSSDYQYLSRYLVTYDESKNVISRTQYADSVSTGDTVKYIRLTIDVGSAWNHAQVTKGESLLPYGEYHLLIPRSVIENGDAPEPGSSVVFYLPKHIYVASGRTIELYYEQICLNAHLYNIQAVCSIGRALERKFQIIGDTSHIGNTYTLSINVRDNAGNILASGSSTIHIVSNVIASAKKVLPIGDSLTNQKPWLTELHELSANLSTVGTRENRHEGRSGATVSTYNNVTGGIVYDYDSEYRGPGYGTAPDFSDSENYTAGTIVKTEYNSRYRYWIFKVDHTAGSFDQDECFCLSDGNPFYDYENETFSMSFYKTFYSKTYDAIIIYLGANGQNLTPETNPNGALGLKTLIENIRVDEPTIPILVVNTIFRSNQNGIGKQGNVDGYVAQSEYKYNADKKVLLLAKATDELCGSMSNVYLCPVGATHDSKYNFGNTKTQVNPRLTSTDVVYELFPSDSVHPQDSGYYQMADEIFSTLCAVFNP